MQIHILLTKELERTKPTEVKTIFSTEEPIGIFELDKDNKPVGTIYGYNVILEADQKILIDWLKPFENFWVGSGTPQFEEFHKNRIDPKFY